MGCRSVVVLLCALAACGEPTPGLVVETTRGSVEGRSDGAVSTFLGIPFAAPPVGALRFAPPEEPAAWGPEPRAAKAFAPPCVQPGGGSEDCLYLNVWTPDTDGALPVMVWIHGGFFFLGGADQPLYDGAELARRGEVVVVSIQYRLGAFGHLAHEALESSDDPGAGNYAFLDQVAALRWIQREIAAFGGDPGNVTLFGESAGGTSVCTLMMSPLASGLFHKGIIQSQHCASRSLELARTRGGEVVQAAGCMDAADVAGCLREASAEAILAASYDPRDGSDIERVGTSYVPTIDGRLLDDTPAELIAAGRHNAVPVISSSLSEDAFFLLDTYTWEFLDEAGRLVGIPEDQRLAIAAHYQEKYSVENGYPPEYARGMLATDLIVVCPESRLLRQLAAGQDEPVHRLLFDHAPEGFYKQHGLELPYVFQALDRPELAPLARDDDRWIEGTMLDLWTGFARSGSPPSPAGTAGVTWTPFEFGDEGYLVVRSGETAMERDLRNEDCALFGLF